MAGDVPSQMFKNMQETAKSVVNSVIADDPWEDKCYDMVYGGKLPMKDALVEKYGSLTGVLKVFLKSQKLYNDMVIRNEIERFKEEKLREYEKCVHEYNEKVKEYNRLAKNVENERGWVVVGNKRKRM